MEPTHFADKETVEAIQSVLGKTIQRVWMGKSDLEDRLCFLFDEGWKLTLWDGGQLCCEKRYMTCDDNLDYFSGAVLKDILVKDGPVEEDEWGYPHEIQFLEVVTSKGSFTVATHNKHNGYYGGFLIRARAIKLNQITPDQIRHPYFFIFVRGEFGKFEAWQCESEGEAAKLYLQAKKHKEIDDVDGGKIPVFACWVVKTLYGWDHKLAEEGVLVDDIHSRWEEVKATPASCTR